MENKAGGENGSCLFSYGLCSDVVRDKFCFQYYKYGEWLFSECDGIKRGELGFL